MERTAKSAILIISFLIILSHTWQVHSRNLVYSPSPAPESIGAATNTNNLNPYRGRKEKPVRGSYPATCHLKCDECRPCVPIQVSIRTMAVEENQYYPMVWKCMCQSNLFSP